MGGGGVPSGGSGTKKIKIFDFFLFRFGDGLEVFLKYFGEVSGRFAPF